ncbi:hypothetical protein CANARDRAFT_8691 [[Candida] arabinofermentans NRRL YB-2248]|uniref:Uncharacterized protein n=1 Tax=[Candida] arabinofermentans NRRL YB-2248 TaxID=983967 RepID=A0A1E4SXX1_9ASCO|nr:hypothetical protein CANARDRAFT_8691 [[Candida] arabinofermentans NRRL YB-2248]
MGDDSTVAAQVAAQVIQKYSDCDWTHNPPSRTTHNDKKHHHTTNGNGTTNNTNNGHNHSDNNNDDKFVLDPALQLELDKYNSKYASANVSTNIDVNSRQASSSDRSPGQSSHTRQMKMNVPVVNSRIDTHLGSLDSNLPVTLCNRCKKQFPCEAGKNFKMCSHCRELQRQRSRRWQMRTKQKEGACRRCGSPIPKEHAQYVLCEHCRMSLRTRKVKRALAGKCVHCSGPNDSLDGKFKVCTRCRNNDKMRRSNLEKMGACNRCANPLNEADSDHKVCVNCRTKKTRRATNSVANSGFEGNMSSIVGENSRNATNTLLDAPVAKGRGRMKNNVSDIKQEISPELVSLQAQSEAVAAAAVGSAAANHNVPAHNDAAKASQQAAAVALLLPEEFGLSKGHHQIQLSTNDQSEHDHQTADDLQTSYLTHSHEADDNESHLHHHQRNYHHNHNHDLNSSISQIHHTQLDQQLNRQLHQQLRQLNGDNSSHSSPPNSPRNLGEHEQLVHDDNDNSNNGSLRPGSAIGAREQENEDGNNHGVDVEDDDDDNVVGGSLTIPDPDKMCIKCGNHIHIDDLSIDPATNICSKCLDNDDSGLFSIDGDGDVVIGKGI